MINPTGEKLEKLLFGIFDEAIQGVDTYNHNGSLWLIFTDKMRWVVEYTKEQTLWYNYTFFKDEMDMVGLDCVENKHLIQKWFEIRFLNRNEVKKTDNSQSNYRLCVEDTIQNGVKHTSLIFSYPNIYVEDTIQNGVKHTRSFPIDFFQQVEDTIQNGVKHTEIGWAQDNGVEDAIQNGVKETKSYVNNDFDMNDAIQNGVKEIHDDCSNNIARVEGIVRVGEKIN